MFYDTSHSEPNAANSRGWFHVWALLLISLMVPVPAPPVPVKQPKRLSARRSRHQSTHPPDAAASYHFMLGYQAELAQDWIVRSQEYQAALKADPASQSVKARLAGHPFFAGRYAQCRTLCRQVAEGPSQDGHVSSHTWQAF